MLRSRALIASVLPTLAGACRPANNLAVDTSAGVVATADSAGAAKGAGAVVARYVDAYSRGDFAGVRASLADRLTLRHFPPDSGPAAVMPADSAVAALRQAFTGVRDLRVQLLGRLVNGPYVVDHYRARFGGSDSTALFIYEVRGDRITGLWQSAGVAQGSRNDGPPE